MRRGEDADGASRRPQQTYDAVELQDSVFQQLKWLLNSRTPVDYSTLDQRNRDNQRSTVDYGIPDLSNYLMGDVAMMTRLSDHLAETISRFEPRLQNVRVELGRADARTQRLAVTVSGDVVTGMIVIPIRFRPIEIGGGEDDRDAG